MRTRTWAAVGMGCVACLMLGCGQARHQGDPDGEAVTFVVHLEPGFLHDLRTRTASSQGAGASAAVPIGSRFGVPLTATTVSLLGGDAAGEAQRFWQELAWGNTRFTIPLRPGSMITLTLKAEGGHQGLADCGTLVIPRAAHVQILLRLAADGERLALLPTTPGAVRLPGAAQVHGVQTAPPSAGATPSPAGTPAPATAASAAPGTGMGGPTGAGNLAPSSRTVVTADPEGLVPATGPIATPAIPPAPLAPAPAPHPAPARAPAPQPAGIAPAPTRGSSSTSAIAPAPRAGADVLPAAAPHHGGVDVHLGGMEIPRDAASGPGAGLRGQAAPPAPPVVRTQDRASPTPTGGPERLQVHIGIAPPGPAVAPVSPTPDPSRGDP